MVYVFLLPIFFLQLITQIICLSCSSSLYWFYLVEVLFFSTLAMIYLSGDKKSNFFVSSFLIFFFFNALGSLSLFFSLSKVFSEIFFSTGIFMKLGLFPIFLWYPFFLEGLKFFSFFWMNTVNKIIYIMFSIYFLKKSWVVSCVGVSIMLSSIFMFMTRNKIKLFLGFSSLIDSGVMMLMGIKYSILPSMVYLIIYSFFFFLICFKMKKSFKPSLPSILMSGFPPSPLFFFKMLVLFQLFSSKSFETYFLDWLVFAILFSQMLQLSCWFFFLSGVLLNEKSFFNWKI